MNTPTATVKVMLACTALVAVVTLAGCGTSSGPAQGVPTPIGNSALVTQAHNQADITFVENMIAHHRQAVEMSKLAPEHGNDVQVKDLAARIQAGEQSEIDQMNGFLQAWNSSPLPPGGPPADGAPMTGLEPGDPGLRDHDTMPTMMSPQTMTQLSAVTGPAFDKMFLRLMLTQHESGLIMSNTEVKGGQSPEAKALAQRIIDGHQGEISEMRAMGRRIDHGNGGW